MSRIEEVIYTEFDFATDRWYRVVKLEEGKYGREFAPDDYIPTALQLAFVTERWRLREANERWLSEAIQPMTRRRRFRIWRLFGKRRAIHQ